MSLVESWPSTEMRSNERFTQTPSSRSAVSGCSAASVCDEAEHGREARRDHPRALRLRADRTVPDGSATSSVSRFSNASVVAIARQNAASPSRRELPARGQDRARSCRPSASARRSRRSTRPRRGPRARRRPSRPRPACAPRPPARGCRSPRSRCRSWRRRRAARRAGSALASTTGAASTPEAVKRAALTASGSSQTSSARSGSPDGLIPAGTPAARKPAASPPSSTSVTLAGGSTQREAKATLLRALPARRGRTSG